MNMTEKITRKHSIHKLRVRFAAEYPEDVIDMFAYSGVQNKSRLKARLDKELSAISSDESLSEGEKHELEGYLSDELFLSEKTEELAHEMTIIAFYKTIEITIKDMLKFSQLFTDKEINKFWKVKELKEQVAQKVHDMETLNGYAAYDELRLINNCIKHSGKVDKELSIFYSNWKNGDKLHDLDKAYFRLKDDVNKFVVALKNEILAKMKDQ